MKIALAQMEVVANTPKKNLETMLAMIEEAKKQHVDLIAFPEMCIGGYLVGDKWTEEAFCQNLMEFNNALLDASKGIAIAYGNVFVDSSKSNKDGRSRKFNAAYIIQNGKPARRLGETIYLPNGVQPKTLLPNYRIFDDERYFFSLQDVAIDAGVALETLTQPYLISIADKEVPIGFELCEDLWCEEYRRNGEALNPTKMLIDNGAQIIVNLSASPWTYGKNGARDRRVEFLKKESANSFVPFFYVNQVSVQNNGKNFVTFDGGSTVYNKEGKPILFAHAPYEQQLLIADSLDMPEIARAEKPKIAQKYEAIVQAIRHFGPLAGKQKNLRFVLGLSGGIDSAVVAALLSIAVGPENVMAVNMPTKYNSEKTKNVARAIAQNLNIHYREVSIGGLVNAVTDLIEAIDLDGSRIPLNDLTRENIQAKVRGTELLSNLAAKYGAFFTNNGNKLETALGYATLYGDVGGAFAPIGDLTKREVYELGRFLNNEIFKKEVIPDSLFPDELFRFGKDKIIPSAELAKDQIDPMKFGYHCALLEKMTDYNKKSASDIMGWYLEGTMEKNLGISHELLQRWNIHDPKVFVQDLEWFDHTIQKNIFKRIQAPPIIIISKSAYGFDIRESQLSYETTLAHDKIKEKVLQMNLYVPNG